MQSNKRIKHFKLENQYSHRYLPHYEKGHRLQSITYRLSDSLPQEVLRRMRQALTSLGSPLNSPEERIEIEKWLDQGIGSCALGNDVLAEVVQNGFIRFHDDRYRLLAWCIMPNHVHVLIQVLNEYPLGKIVQSWKSFSGRWALRHKEELGLSSEMTTFWQNEYWDRFIRDEQHLKDCIAYIENNPVKAGLCARPDEWKWSSAGVGWKVE